ncbi:MAG: lytic transglycosylase domain-containing protein [Bacteroides sp.]|nr:lytic transglycosylase domain-containing protein [Bacteroides sp.]MCM1378699.1 lytic transglycosylase domain-containing protein [Bacteroides sp.]MCM1444972.1 lytic transglycosylase domain-containing protein [Prevotella sp.]
MKNIKSFLILMLLPFALTAQHLTVTNPDIPRSVTFAGEKLDLADTQLYERLDRELTSMVYTHGNTLLTLKRANRYFQELAKIMKQYGVNEDFIYMACIESFLNPIARSAAGAAGIWQFMPATAKQYGLEVTDEVDERYDPIKETAAACKYINAAFEKYGDWASVASSYNGGTARITKELDAQQQDNALNLWLADETRRYPLRMVAMKMIMENPSKYGFELRADQLYQPYEYITETVDYTVDDWPTWAKERGISYATLREYNPWIRAKTLTNKNGKSYEVRIPKAESLKRSSSHLKTYNDNWLTK